MKRLHGNDNLKKIKTPEKKAKRVVNSIGTNYEDTNYMVCPICIKVFKTNDKYILHMVDHQKQLSLNEFPIMKVFKEVLENEAGNIDAGLHYKRVEELKSVPAEPPPTTSRSCVMEKDGDPYSTAQAIIKLGLPETLGVTIKNMASTINTINNTCITLQGINNITITTDEFRRAITSMSNNIRDQLLRRILQSPYFTLHVAEFLDIKNFTTIIVTARYKYETRIQDEILFCQRLEAPMADEIYLVASNFMREHQLNWENCVGISMDGVRAQCEPLKHFMERIFNFFAPNLTYTFSRRASFIEQHLPDTLAETLHDSVAIINILKMNATLKFESDMDKEYQQIFYHTDQYWLSYGRLLTKLFEMRDKCKTIPDIVCFKDKINDTNWLHKLAYLADIFECFSRLNRDLQTEQFSTFHIYDKIAVMIDLLKMYKTNVEQHNFTQFSNLQQLMIMESQRNVNPEITAAILENLRRLQNNMNRYLPIASEFENCSWIRNPFNVNPDKMPLNFSVGEKEMLLNLKKDGFIAAKFDEEKLDYFWALADKKYPDLAIKAIKYLLIFKNSHLSEMGFATLVDIRTKMLTDLEYEDLYVRIKLSNIEPELKTLSTATN